MGPTGPRWAPCCPHEPCYLRCIVIRRSNVVLNHHKSFNILRPRQNGRHFAEDIFKRIFLNENIWIPIKISLKFVSKGSINNIPALVQIMAWRRQGDKPLSEPMMVSSLTYICVTRPRWVLNKLSYFFNKGYQLSILSNWYTVIPSLLQAIFRQFTALLWQNYHITHLLMDIR